VRWNSDGVHSIKYGVAGDGGYEQNFKEGHAIVTGLSSLMPGFYPKPAYVMDKVTHWDKLFSEYFNSPLSLFHQSFIFLFHSCTVIAT
jgi:hypothetical protein